jgi:hypothetical protein
MKKVMITHGLASWAWNKRSDLLTSERGFNKSADAGVVRGGHPRVRMVGFTW